MGEKKMNVALIFNTYLCNQLPESIKQHGNSNFFLNYKKSLESSALKFTDSFSSLILCCKHLKSYLKVTKIKSVVKRIHLWCAYYLILKEIRKGLLFLK